MRKSYRRGNDNWHICCLLYILFVSATFSKSSLFFFGWPLPVFLLQAREPRRPEIEQAQKETEGKMKVRLFIFSREGPRDPRWRAMAMAGRSHRRQEGYMKGRHAEFRRHPGGRELNRPSRKIRALRGWSEWSGPVAAGKGEAHTVICFFGRC